MNADLLPVPPTGLTLTPIDRRQLLTRVHSLHQELCGSAGRVGLLIVVDLCHLNVKLRPQHPGDIPQCPGKYRNTQREIGAPQHRGGASQRLQLPELIRRVARGAGEQRRSGTADIGADFRQSLRPGEVNHHVCHLAKPTQLVQIFAAKSRFHLVAGGPGSLLEEPPHLSPPDQDISHSSPTSFMVSLRTASFAGLIAQSGIRMGPTFSPIRFMAALTGMGLTSMNRWFISFRYFR